MPIYEYSCRKHGNFTQYLPLLQAGSVQGCPICHDDAERIYSFSLKKEFFAYDDAQYKRTISSEKEERKLMKEHGHVYTRDTPFYNTDRMKHTIKLARKKPIYSTPAGITKMDRD